MEVNTRETMVPKTIDDLCLDILTLIDDIFEYILIFCFDEDMK